MMLSFRICAIILSLTLTITIAAPVSDVTPDASLIRGDGSSKGSPRRGVFKIEGWLDLAEVDCYIMLCIIGGKVFQRGPNSAYGETQRSEWGSKNQPFQDKKLTQYKTTRASDKTVSPEDFPWRSVQLQKDANGEYLENRYLTGGPSSQQSSQGGSVNAGYNGAYGGDVIGYNEWFEINIRPADYPLRGPMCIAWMMDDTSVCGKDKKVDVLGVAGIVLAQLVYYYVKSEGKYFHASQKGKKRSVDSVQWDVDPETLAWPSIPADAEEVKRAIVVLDEAGNELARSGKRAVVELDGEGNELSMRKLKRAALELDEAGNDLE